MSGVDTVVPVAAISVAERNAVLRAIGYSFSRHGRLLTADAKFVPCRYCGRHITSANLGVVETRPTGIVTFVCKEFVCRLERFAENEADDENVEYILVAGAEP